MSSTGGRSIEKILLVSGDGAAQCGLRDFLERCGYRVFATVKDSEALTYAAAGQPGLIIVDATPPPPGRLRLLERLRRSGVGVPILAVCGCGSASERLQGLMFGADDFICKPFDEDELFARTQALLHRRAAPGLPHRILKLGAATVDLRRLIVTIDGHEFRLSRAESALLDLLARRAGEPVSRSEMAETIRPGAGAAVGRAVDTHIWRLRKKLRDDGSEPHGIKNVPGIGYRLDGDGPPANRLL